jgi:FkbM family methyltransferase
MSSDPVEPVTFTTPGGHPAHFLFRPDTTDWNTLASITTHDEYGLPSGLTGWAADIGAHIGGATIALCLDNPDLNVIALEPLPENLEMIRANVAENGIGARVAVVEGLIGTDEVLYGWTGNDSQRAHRYIGNMTGESSGPQSVARPRRYTLADLLDLAGGSLEFVKTDCEGGEWDFLTDPRMADVRVIAGEWHGIDGHDASDVVAILGATHDVTTDTGVGGGGFRATRRV